MKMILKKLLGRYLHEPNIDRTKHKPPLRVTPKIDGRRFLFIGGLHRSGTSVLHRLLRDSEATAGIHDAGVPEDEGQFLQSVFPTGRFFGASGHFAFAPGAHLTGTSELASTKNRDLLLREWGAYYNLQKRVFLEKSPPNIIRSLFFQELFPDSRFVFIMRHPVAVSLATKKWAGSSIMELLLHWYIAHRILFEDLKELRNFLVFRYEDFVMDPQFYCDEICRFTGIEPFGLTEQVRDHNPKYFKEWSAAFESERRMVDAYFEEIGVFTSGLGYVNHAPFAHPLAGGRFVLRSNKNA